MIDPRSKSLVLNGKPGHLQFYSLLRDKLLYNVSRASDISHQPGHKSFSSTWNNIHVVLSAWRKPRLDYKPMFKVNPGIK